MQATDSNQFEMFDDGGAIGPRTAPPVAGFSLPQFNTVGDCEEWLIAQGHKPHVCRATSSLQAGVQCPETGEVVLTSERNVPSNTFRKSPGGDSRGNPFVSYIAGNREEGFLGGVFHAHTGEEVARTREPWSSANHLEPTLDKIAQQHWVRWLQLGNEAVPAWLLMRTAVQSVRAKQRRNHA